MTYPTRNPSTAGARWLFQQKEYLRRVGDDTPVNRERFGNILSEVQGMDDAALLRRLQRLRAKYGQGGSEFYRRALEGEIGVVEAEVDIRSLSAEDAAAKRRELEQEERAAKHAALLKTHEANSDKKARRAKAAQEGELAKATVKRLAAILGTDVVAAQITAAAVRIGGNEAARDQLIEDCRWAERNGYARQGGRADS